MELSDRELAFRWWNRKTNDEKTELAKQAKIIVDDRDFDTLTGNEIEYIWKNQSFNK
jgi:hypothetical protein